MIPKTTLALLSAALLPLAAATAQMPGQQDPKIPETVGEPTTTKSGLKYWVLKRGPAPKKGEVAASPELGDKVKVHYSGWLKNGKLFDSSVKRGTPAEFALGRVIEGWNEGLQLMKPGDKFLFEIPSLLGYGARGSGGSIPPNSDLIFEVELISFVSVPKPPKWRELDPKKTKTTDSGLKYEVLKAGEGASPKANEVFELGLAFYNKSGKMIQAQLDPSQLLKASADKMNLPFLKEGPLLMSAGAEFWFEVPAKLAWGAQSPGPDIGANETTYWYLKMVRVVKPLPLPKFELPGDDELTKTASGLKYKVLREGKGDSPKAFQTVKVHYCGWQTDGKNFDSSYSRGEPTSFPLNRVIKGWTEGVQLMKPGAKYLFVIPGRLAYGDPVPGQPSGGRPLGTLVFVVELLEIVR